MKRREKKDDEVGYERRNTKSSPSKKMMKCEIRKE